MKKKCLLLPLLFCFCFVHSQNQKNEIEVRTGKVAFPDWNGVYMGQQSVSYLRQFKAGLFVKGSAYFYGDYLPIGLIANLNSSKGTVLERHLTEFELGTGYRFQSSCVFFRAGAALLYRYRDEVYFDEWLRYSLPPYEFSSTDSSNRDLGVSIYGSCYIYLWKHITAGLYLDQKFYNHGTNSTSYGLQVGVTF